MARTTKRSLATLPRRWVGSEGREIIAHATQKGRRVTTNLLAVSAELLGGLPHQKRGGVTSDPWSRSRELVEGIEHIAPHTKRTWGHKVLLGGRVTSAPATQNRNRVTRNFPEASKILHLPHKKKVGSPLSPMICTCHTKRRWGHKRPLGPGRAKTVRKRRKILRLPHKANV